MQDSISGPEGEAGREQAAECCVQMGYGCTSLELTACHCYTYRRSLRVSLAKDASSVHACISLQIFEGCSFSDPFRPMHAQRYLQFELRCGLC